MLVLFVMASSAGDGTLKPLQRAMKLANRAIQLDTGHRPRDAYVEYLKTVNFISRTLAEEAEETAAVNEGLGPDSQKMLKLAEQCLERARTTADKLGKPDVNLPSPENLVSEVPDPPPALKPTSTTSIFTPSTSRTSRASLSRQYGHRRACSDEVRKVDAFPTPEVFQMLRAAEVQSSRKELTPLEEASIQNQKLRAAYEVRLARLDPRQASQKTSLTLSLQRQMMENLVIAKAREETLQRKAEERRLRLQEESNRRFSKNKQMTPAEEEQKTLYTAVLEYEQDYEWPKEYLERIKSNPSDSDLVSSYVCQILSTSDHPIAKLVLHLQCQIYSRLYPVISKDASQETSKMFRHSLPPDPSPLSALSASQLKSSKSFHCLPGPPRSSIPHSRSIGEGLESWENPGSPQPDRGHSGTDMENSFEDLESLLSPTSLTLPAALQRLNAAQHLHVVVKEIHNARDRLLSSAMFSLNLPSSPQVKEACRECLEDGFFPPLWSALLALYRQVLLAREESLLQVMDLYSFASPSVLGVSKKLYPEDVKQPYRAAVEELEYLPHQRTPQRKLECIVRTLRVICECAEEYVSTPGTAAIGADDLLPILAFVVLKSRMSHLLSECAALEEFIQEGYLIGEEGYCLTSLQSALAYLETLPVPPSPPPV
ncbi:VPS9 domain-containing protein 1 [Bufo bufo]|uniref:VPS9 domain-containing protein 1 n=1 Tax=Bufo bufo TaxID=8384 RepID=UPI001ABDD7B1|nr:VPS9 domain-containing protein 1 [Bufo bufo]